MIERERDEINRETKKQIYKGNKTVKKGEEEE